MRDLEGCRRSATSLSKTQGGSTNDPVSYEVGMCGAQPQAFCRCLWSDMVGGGEHECYRVTDDCTKAQGQLLGGVSKQSACTAYE